MKYCARWLGDNGQPYTHQPCSQAAYSLVGDRSILHHLTRCIIIKSGSMQGVRIYPLGWYWRNERRESTQHVQRPRGSISMMLSSEGNLVWDEVMETDINLPEANRRICIFILNINRSHRHVFRKEGVWWYQKGIYNRPFMLPCGEWGRKNRNRETS